MAPALARDPAATLFDALLRADHMDASEALENALDAGLKPVQVLDEVLAPALHEVGRHWETGQIGITEEHLASSVAHRMLARLAPLLVTAPAGSRPSVLMAGAQGERHVLGLQMAADVLEGAGYRVKMAGADVPARALISWTERERPALLGISCTGAWAAAADIRSAITALVDTQPGLGIMLGGRGWQGFVAPPNGRVVLLDSMRDLLPTAAALTASA